MHRLSLRHLVSPRHLALLLLVPLFALGLTAADAAAASEKKVIYFATWSADMDDAAQAVIAEAVGVAQAHPKDPVRVSGFASTIGSVRANQLLAELRAQVVADKLMEKGVSPSRIRISSRGLDHFVSTTLESRRVEVSVGGR